jgi:hypothetical protein
MNVRLLPTFDAVILPHFWVEYVFAKHASHASPISRMLAASSNDTSRPHEALKTMAPHPSRRRLKPTLLRGQSPILPAV